MVTSCMGALAFLGLAALPISTPMAAAMLLFLANLEVRSYSQGFRLGFIKDEEKYGAVMLVSSGSCA
jgi:hypothetical protein